MLGHTIERRKRKNGKLSSREYMDIIRIIREAPVELSNEDVMDEVTKTYGTSQSLMTKPISFSDYVFQIVTTVFIVILFIITISYVSYKTADVSRTAPMVEVFSADVVF